MILHASHGAGTAVGAIHWCRGSLQTRQGNGCHVLSSLLTRGHDRLTLGNTWLSTRMGNRMGTGMRVVLCLLLTRRCHWGGLVDLHVLLRVLLRVLRVLHMLLLLLRGREWSSTTGRAHLRWRRSCRSVNILLLLDTLGRDRLMGILSRCGRIVHRLEVARFGNQWSVRRCN